MFVVVLGKRSDSESDDKINIDKKVLKITLSETRHRNVFRKSKFYSLWDHFDHQVFLLRNMVHQVAWENILRLIKEEEISENVFVAQDNLSNNSQSKINITNRFMTWTIISILK